MHKFLERVGRQRFRSVASAFRSSILLPSVCTLCVWFFLLLAISFVHCDSPCVRVVCVECLRCNTSQPTSYQRGVAPIDSRRGRFSINHLCAFSPLVHTRDAFGLYAFSHPIHIKTSSAFHWFLRTFHLKKAKWHERSILEMNITFINDVLSMRVWMSISSMLPLIYVIDRAIDNRTKVPSMKRTKKRYLATEIHRRAFTLQNRVQRRYHI